MSNFDFIRSDLYNNHDFINKNWIVELMDLQNEEFDSMQLDVTVTPELGFGYGKISAINRYSDGTAREAASEVRSFVKKIESGTPCGCIDGRCVMCTLAGEVVLGPKLAGGIAESTLGALELSGYFDDDKNIFHHFGQVVNLLEDNNLPVRFHIDTDHQAQVMEQLQKHQQKYAHLTDINEFIVAIETDKIDYQGTGCGMGDQFVAAIGNLAARLRPDESDDQMQARLDFIRHYAAAIKGETFDKQAFDQQQGRANQLVDSGHLQSWNSLKALIITDRILQDRGETNGALSRIDVLETSGRGVHGHVEDFVVINKVPNTTVDQTAYARATDRQIFTVDDWLTESISDAAGNPAVAQAVTAVNLAGYVQLTDGSQRAVVLTQQFQI